MDIHLLEDELTKEYLAEGEVGGLAFKVHWRKGEGITKTLIGMSVPNTIFNRISTEGTAKGIWDALKRDYEDRTLMTTVDLVRRFRTKCCADKDNIHTHFQELLDLHDQLAAIGKTVDDDDFTATLLASLPLSYSHACTSINSSIHLGAVTLTSAITREIILEEYDR